MSNKNDDSLEQHLEGALGNESRRLMKSQLQQLDQKIIARQRMNRLFVIFGIALIVMLGGMFLIEEYFTPTSTTSTSKEIFASNFEPYPNIVAPITKGDENTTEREKAFQYYEQGDYATALPLLGKLGQEDVPALFYQAVILLNDEKPETAAKHFSNIQNSNHPTFSTPAQWYLALSYLQANDIEKAKSTLKELVSNNNHPYQEKAKNILEALK